jgi:hypothetical protein
MARISPLALLALVCALAGCTSSQPKGNGSSEPPSARAGFGGPSSATLVVSEVDEVVFRTPSKNIFCALRPSAVRCEILQKKWQPPAKPATCDFDWGGGLFIESGKVDFLCVSDSVFSEAKTTLDYGRGYRSGDVLCDSESAGLTCRDEKTGRGFTLASARYSVF